jgi:hypothetical protein
VSRTDKTKKLKLFSLKTELEVTTHPKDGELFIPITWVQKLTERRDK